MGMMTEEVRAFVEHVMEVRSGLPDIIGAAAGDSAGYDPSAQLALELRRKTVDFAQAYDDPNVGDDRLKELAAQVEGTILSLATIMRFSAEYTDQLVGELHALVRARHGHAGTA